MQNAVPTATPPATPAATPSAAPTALPAPVAAAERIASIDVVRGLAVLGILVMNVVEFGQPLQAYENPAYAGGSEGLDLVTWFVQATLFDGKMRALFSMLFGAGIVLIDERMVSRGQGASAADLLLRRCLWLVPFGIAHRFGLQWTGDILYQYGLLALIAIPFRRLRARSLLVLGILTLSAVVATGTWGYLKQDQVRAQAAEAVRLEKAGETVPKPLADAKKNWERRAAAARPQPEALAQELKPVRGSYGDLFSARWDYHHQFQSAYLYYYFVWDVLGMMFLGMALMKLGFFAGRSPTRVYVTMMAIGGVAALAVLGWAIAWQRTGFSAAEPELHALKETTYSYTRALVALAWASALLLLLRADRLRWITSALGQVGRMAFSNYIVQTICCTLLFFGYGWGFYGQWSRSRLMLVVLAVSLVQVLFSIVWLRIFRFGPMEWAWRSLTYWRVQPLLRRGEVASP